MSQRWAGIRGTPSGRKSLSQALDEAQRCGTRGWSLGRRETWIACHSQGSSAAAITFSNVPYPVACVTNKQGNSALTCLLDFCLRSRALPRNLTLNQIFDHIDYAAVMIMNQFFVFLFVITDKTSNQKKKKNPANLQSNSCLTFLFPFALFLWRIFTSLGWHKPPLVTSNLALPAYPHYQQTNNEQWQLWSIQTNLHTHKSLIWTYPRHIKR